MKFLRYLDDIVKEHQARALLGRFAAYGASVHRLGHSNRFVLLLPLDQRKVDRALAHFNSKFDGMFSLVEVENFGLEPVFVRDENQQREASADGRK